MTVDPNSLSAEPRLRRFLAAVPTPLLRRFVWDRVKHWRRTAVVNTVFDARIRCDTRDALQRRLYFFGVWEPNLTSWLQGRLQPGDVFVDVGANIGYYSLLASRVTGPAGHVVAIEASPAIFAALEANLSLNAVENVRAISAAAADAERSLLLVPGRDINIGCTMTLDAPADAAGARVQGRPLYDLLTREERERVRLIKVDVEGAEADVLGGLHLERADFRSDLELVVEIAPERLAERGHAAHAVLEALRALGFHAYTVENDYRSRGYLQPGAFERPVRLTGPLERQADVVFSRVDADTL